MAGWEQVRELALALPETSEDTGGRTACWRVRRTAFAWERPLRKGDLAHVGDAAPAGPVLGARVPDLDVRAAMVATHPWCFTIPHYAGFAAVLVALDDVPYEDLDEVLTEAWLCRAPKRLAKAFLDGLPGS